MIHIIVASSRWVKNSPGLWRIWLVLGLTFLSWIIGLTVANDSGVWNSGLFIAFCIIQWTFAQIFFTLSLSWGKASRHLDSKLIWFDSQPGTWSNFVHVWNRMRQPRLCIFCILSTRRQQKTLCGVASIDPVSVRVNCLPSKNLSCCFWGALVFTFLHHWGTNTIHCH